MNKLLLTILFLPSFKVFSQSDYDLYKSYTRSTIQELNKKIISTTEYQQDKKIWTKTSLQQFNPVGLPTAVIQYDQQGKETTRKEFVYDSARCISKIETYKNGTHEATVKFEINSFRQVIAYTDYVYSSYSGEKMTVWETRLEYNFNETLKKQTKLEGDSKDTVQIDFYNKVGVLTKSLWNYSGLRTKKIEYSWNSDSTEMKEMHYENDSTIYNTITHHYKERKEIKKIDPVSSPQPIYWKYDEKGRVIETNEQYFYVQYIRYDTHGYPAVSGPKLRQN